MSTRRMRTAIPWAALLLLLLHAFGGCSAFQAPRRRSTASSPAVSSSSSSSRLSSSSGGLGWDNENFLESLSKGPDAIEKANADYERTKRQIGLPARNDNNSGSAAAAPPVPPIRDDGGDDEIGSVPDATTLSAEQIERIKRQNEEETSGGGEMFKKLLERSQEAQQSGGAMKQRPPSSAADSSSSTAATGTGGAPALPAGFENLSVEAQAALFRELMKNPQTPSDQPQQQQTFPGPPPGPRPAATGQAAVAADGRRIGRNRDADAIVNTADVYFAQLKKDSQVRNRARYEGDHDKAEAVFADPALQEIKLHVNPYMEEQRRKELAMLDTAPEEMINPDFFRAEKPLDKSDTGISYKEKLQQQRQKKQQKQPPQQQPAASTTVMEAPSSLPKPKVETPPPTQVEPPAMVVVETPPSPQKSEPVVEKETPPEQQQQAPMAAAATTQVTPPPPTPDRSSGGGPSSNIGGSIVAEETRRRDLRTLMGLLLKHRGGPGFGAGRLRGPEAAQLAQLSKDLLAALRAEAAAAPAVPEASVAVVAPVPPVSTATSTGGGGAIEQSRAPAGERIRSMIACIEGAILMFKNSPPELQGSVLVTLRAALLSAVSTCNDIVGQTENVLGGTTTTGTGASATPVGDRVNSMIACIEGAILMFKNSPPELQGSVLVTLRAALLSAINTFNEILATSDSGSGNDDVSPGFGAATAAATTTTRSTPVQFTDVVPEISQPEQQPPTAPSMPEPPAEFSRPHTPQDILYNGDDENSEWLESVYEKLKNAVGDGKMGLREDLSPEDAEDLANDISQMRMMLVEELESGIPESSSAAAAGAKSSSSPSTTSKYQEMLAKARAETEGKEFE